MNSGSSAAPGSWLLEHHPNVLAAQCRELLVGQAGLVDAVGADPVVGVCAGLRVGFGSGAVGDGGLWGMDGGARDSTVLNDAVATQGPDHPARRVLLRQADRYQPREFGIHESDGAPDEKEGRPKHEHLVTRRAWCAVKCGLGVRRAFLA